MTVLALLTAVFLLGHSGAKAGLFAPLSAAIPPTYIHIAAAILLIWTAEASPSFKRWMSGTFAARVGEMSFPLYLIHVPIQCSLGAFAFLWAAPSLGVGGAAVAGALATVAGALALVVPLMIFNRRWLELINWCTNAIWSAAPAGLRLPRPAEAVQLDLPLRNRG